MMFARNVHFQLKTGKEREFQTLFTNDVLPVLRKQEGFKNELALVNQGRVIGISLWTDRASAERYHSTTYPKIVEKLSPVMEGSPKVETYDVAATTLTA